jgi:nitrile hydratase
MNGVHDMGGMQGFGPIRPEQNGAASDAPWQERILAIYLALGRWGRWTSDFARQTRESLPPVVYLTLDYNQRRYAQVVELLLGADLATRAEIESGIPALGTPRLTPPFTAGQVPVWFAAGTPRKRNLAVASRFRVGQRVRARDINPVTHTRLPRYARGRLGTIMRDYGVSVFPDSNARGLGEKPQHLYSVQFAARELWGEQAKPKDTVYIDMWADYLEAA